MYLKIFYNLYNCGDILSQNRNYYNSEKIKIIETNYKNRRYTDFFIKLDILNWTLLTFNLFKTIMIRPKRHLVLFYLKKQAVVSNLIVKKQKTMFAKKMSVLNGLQNTILIWLHR